MMGVSKLTGDERLNKNWSQYNPGAFTQISFCALRD